VIGVVAALIWVMSLLNSAEGPRSIQPRPAPPSATPTPGDGPEPPSTGDAFARRLDATCRSVQAELEDLPRPPQDYDEAGDNAAAEARILDTLAGRLDQVPSQHVDAKRRRAVKRYLTLLGRERALDTLIVQATVAEDDVALAAFADQNVTNRAKRRRVADRLRAPGCRPGPVVTR
jgi:hypothetical protein